MPEQDVISWGALIDGYAKDNRNSDRVFDLLMEMDKQNIKPSDGSLLTILGVVADRQLHHRGKWMHDWLISKRKLPNLRLENALLSMHSRCGSLSMVRTLFDSMSERDVVSWNILLDAHGRQGMGKEVLSLLDSMQHEGYQLDGITWVVVLSACSHSGLVDEGLEMFRKMIKQGALVGEQHFSCVVDLLARAGRLDEAEGLALEMSNPGPITWMTLLGACRSQKDDQRAERIFKRLMETTNKEEYLASAMVLLGNIFASVGRHDDAMVVRNNMKEQGIHKIPGQSWIEIDGKQHIFVANDWNHPEAKAIHDKCEEVFQRISLLGHQPDTSWVLQDVGEEDKIKSLCKHSEKMALGYGLLKTNEGEPLVVFKNLRMCGDCHNATRLISLAFKRDIMVRDARRFHHFHDGHCSCADKY